MSFRDTWPVGDGGGRDARLYDVVVSHVKLKGRWGTVHLRCLCQTTYFFVLLGDAFICVDDGGRAATHCSFSFDIREAAAAECSPVSSISAAAACFRLPLLHTLAAVSETGHIVVLDSACQWLDRCSSCLCGHRATSARLRSASVCAISSAAGAAASVLSDCSSRLHHLSIGDAAGQHSGGSKCAGSLREC